ncbi:uncharacterized protein LOC101852173 [Aplysia californica]|uniref:Uncharacterized protein LOC101852173 n=1 Tax=Aplysia californica TaxID=6500 RepID=A0ABM0JM95_APLCA|nr:uncharacterized protein LOC101852173 [Aplysia californica]
MYCVDTGEKKLYILMIACALTRAVHIELVDSLSVEDCILALRRFSARRGIPSVIYSDNAKTFKGVSNLIQCQMGPMTITWKSNAPLAPWWEGWRERLIRSTKSGLRKTNGKRSVTRTHLETLIHEVEACINSRPLTYAAEMKNPLTPSHFLIGRGTPMVSAEITDYCRDFADFQRREQVRQNAIEQFWRVWQNEYIRCLPPMRLRKPNEEMKIGSLALIREEGRPRLQWPLAVVTKLYPGRDGFVRAVELKTGKGKISRPIQRLHKLEIFEEQDNEEGELQGPLQGDSDPWGVWGNHCH